MTTSEENKNEQCKEHHICDCMRKRMTKLEELSYHYELAAHQLKDQVSNLIKNFERIKGAIRHEK